jgi:hypothetical protein
MSKLAKLLNHPILFFKDMCKKHDLKIFVISSKQLSKKIEVTLLPSSSETSSKRSASCHLDNINWLNYNISGKIQKAVNPNKNILVDPIVHIDNSVGICIKAYLILKNKSINFRVTTNIIKTAASTINILQKQAKMYIKAHCPSFNVSRKLT